MNRRKFLVSAVALAVSPVVPAIAAQPFWVGLDFGFTDITAITYYGDEGAWLEEPKRFTVDEVSRAFNVPPHMLKGE